MCSLPAQVAHAKAQASAFATSLRDVEPQAINSREALARLPVVRKPELMERQRAHFREDVFGGFSAVGWGTGAARGAYSARPGPSMNPKATPLTTGAWPARSSLPAFAPAT